MNTLQIAGWSSLLGGLALGAGASAMLNAAQTSEGSAQRMLRRFDQGAGAHPVFAQVEKDYGQLLDRAATMRSAALALTITAGVAFLTGVTLAIVGASHRRANPYKPQPSKSERRKARRGGISLRRGLSLRF